MLKKSLLALVVLGSCEKPPTGDFSPFIHVTVVDPVGFVAPLGENWEVTTASILNGNPISNTNEILDPANPLPSDFTISFSEQVRGQNVTILIEGFADGVSVFSGTGAAVAGSADIEVVALFCGDAVIDDDRSERCDNGVSNSDTEPDACRVDCSEAHCGDAVIDAGEGCDNGTANSDTVADTCRSDCQLPSCGDGVVDLLVSEACDDGNLVDADGCEADCTLPTCQNDISDPEDFQGNLCFFENTPSNFLPETLDLEVKDMDNDGFQDVVFRQGIDIKIAFGDALGGISEIKTVLTNFPNLSNIEVVDFNNDSFLDVAVGSFSNFSNNIEIMKNDDQRNFSLFDSIVFSSAVRDFCVGEFNGDIRKDIFAISGSGLFLVRGVVPAFGNPLKFNSPLQISNFSSIGTINSMECGDIEQDGKDDIILTEILTNNEDSRISIGRGANNSSFSFTSKTVTGISSKGAAPPAFLPFLFGLAIFDKDGDLDKEIAMLDSNSNTLAIILTSNGTVSQNSTVEAIIIQNEVDTLKAAKIDSDTFDDLVVLKGPSVLLSSQNYQETLVGDSTTSFGLGLGDLNNDGFVDIVEKKILF
jgi:cysteine-rich repeat protein